LQGAFPIAQFPIVPGHEVAGTVEETGEGVEWPEEGARVGMPWLYSSCGHCEQCTRGDEVLCQVAPQVTGITLSEPQAALARERVAAAGLADRVEIRVQDYRELAGGGFDAVASIGMVEHVGNAQIDRYAATLHAVLRPGGRLLNHGIARLRHGDAEAGPFSERYVFPDAAPLHLSRIVGALEGAGFEPRHVEGLRSDYVETLTHWLRNLEGRLDEAVALAGEERVRVWRLYLRAARTGFATGFTSVFQVLATRS
jgi:cyclopropane-fatty-acyl-phospholipid synthase